MRKYQLWAAIQALNHAKEMITACEPLEADSDSKSAYQIAVAEWQDELQSLDSMMHAYRREFDGATS